MSFVWNPNIQSFGNSHWMTFISPVRRLWVVCSQRVRPTRRISRPFVMRPPPFQRHQDANGKAFYEKAWQKNHCDFDCFKTGRLWQWRCEDEKRLVKEMFGISNKNCLSFCYWGENAWKRSTLSLDACDHVVEMPNLMQEMPKLSMKLPSKECLVKTCRFFRWLERRTHPRTL